MQTTALKSEISFLIYNNRSGSTYLSALLDNFEEIGVTLESPILYGLLTGKKTYRSVAEINTVISHIYTDRKFKEWDVPQKELQDRLIANLPISKKEFIYLILEIYFRRIKPNAKFWICKIGNPYLIRKINKIFQNTKFIFIYRDGRAVFCSQKKTFSRNIGDVMEKDPVRAAKIWLKYIQIIKTLASEADIIKVKYEDLILNTGDELKRLYGFLTGSEYNKEGIQIQSTSYAEKIPPSQSHLHSNVGGSPLKSRIDGWKDEISFSECYLFEKKAYFTLKEMQYEILCYKTPNSIQFESKYHFQSIQLFFKRVLQKFNRIIFFILRPSFAWKKLITRLETIF